MVQSIIPRNADEAYRIFLEEEREEAPPDCHRHCTHFETDGECCGCGEKNQVPVPVAQFFEEQPGRPIEPLNPLSWDYDYHEM